MNVVTRQHIHESNLIEGYDDPEIDEQSALAWDWLRRQKVITHEVIQELNRRVTAHQTDLDDMWRGTYRSRSRTRVIVGNTPGAEPVMVDHLMENWLLDFLTSDPIQSHIQFERIHPFIDGNGRTGRMLMWWLQRKQNKKPTLLLQSDVENYYSWFRDA